MDQSELVWYFAYGSNMSLDKLTGGRGVLPSRAVRVRIPGWRLTLDIGGLPYQEPAFTSVGPIDAAAAELKQREVVGVAYLITRAEWTSIVASEGGGTVYSNLTLTAETLTEDEARSYGESLQVLTLGTDFGRSPPARPSRRYWDIILQGADYHELPNDYLAYLRSMPVYEAPEGARRKVGATLFLAFWGPIMGLAEKVTKASTSHETGNAPLGTVLFVRLVLIVMWFVHDFIFAPIFGRGDGLDDSDLQLAWEKC